MKDLAAMIKSTKRILHFLVILLLIGISDASAGTCALCRQTLAIGGGPGLVKGIYWSILLIAGMPFLIFTIAIITCFKQKKKSEEKRKAEIFNI